MTRRPEQVNSLIQQELNEIIVRELEFPTDCLVTITKVKVAGDLKHACVWVSVLPIDRWGSVLEILNKKHGFLQGLLGKRLETYRTPKLEFKIDDIEEKAEEVEELLKKI